MQTRSSSSAKPAHAELHNLLFGKASYRPQQLSACLARAGVLRGSAAISFITVGLDMCRELYLASRSLEAVPVARACMDLANKRGEMALRIRAISVLGNVMTDCGDLIGAVQQHRESLLLAENCDDRRNIANAYANLGAIYNYASDYRASIDYYQRALDTLSELADSQLRFGAYDNMAHNYLIVGKVSQGLQAISKCMAIEATSIIRPHSLIVRRRNHIRLLIQAGRLNEVPSVLAELAELVKDNQTPRTELALLLSRGSFEVARGHPDLGRTLLAQALERAKEATYGIGDTLIAMQQAEKAAGNRRAAAEWLAQVIELAGREALKKEHRCAELANIFAQSSQDLPLSEKSWRMLSLLHLPTKTIAEQLDMKPDSVRRYLTATYRTIGASSKTDAAIWYQKQLTAKNCPATINWNDPCSFASYALSHGLRASLGWLYGLLQPHDSDFLARLERNADPTNALAVVPIEDMRWHMAGFFHHRRSQDDEAATDSAALLYRAILRRLQLQNERTPRSPPKGHKCDE